MIPQLLLSAIVFFPLLGVLLILLMANEGEEGDHLARRISLYTTGVVFAMSVWAWYLFDPTKSGFQFQESFAWLGGTIRYRMGVDGISLPFVILTAFLMPLCILASWVSIDKRVKEYMIAFLVLETLMIGVFTALDLVVFYLFFEGGLIPMFLIIGIWGGPRRVYASFKFFLYTLLGSVLMLIAIMAMYVTAGTTDIPALMAYHFPREMQTWLFLAFLASFAVKLPMWPVHTWLPDAHVEAPTAGSVILAGILLKMGGYGFLRFSLPMFPDASVMFAPMMFTLSVVAIVYTSLVALAQEDIKKLIAYSSVAHMGFVTMGLFALNRQGVDGAVVQMISHGFISAALFLCVGIIYDRMHTREIKAYGGLVHRMPIYAAVFMVFTLGNVGLPGTTGFIGEFLSLVGVFQVNTWVAIFATTGIILSAGYALWLYGRVMFGVLEKASLQQIPDMGLREVLVMAPLVAATLYFGVYPKPIFTLTGTAVEQTLAEIKVELANTASAEPLIHTGGRPMTDAQLYIDAISFAPELALAIGAMLLLLVGVFSGDRFSETITWACVSLIGVTAFFVVTGGAGRVLAFNGGMVADPFGRFMKLTVLAGSALALLMSLEFLRDEKLARFEYPLLVALATLGMLIMVSANDLIVLYLGLELQSLALYVLAAFARDTVRSSEAGLKYFVLGALSSGMLLYGASLIYGFTGSTNFDSIAATIASSGMSIGLIIGLVFLLAGLAFKISAVPFHMWAPDVYEGSPTPVTAFFAGAPKIAAIALFLRVVFGPFAGAQHQWFQIIALISVASMILGAVAAIGQSNIKRLMAYSSIGHMGYALIGFAAASPAGVQGVLIYLVIYLAMTAGTFVVIMMMRRNGQPIEDIAELSGLSERDPTSAYLLAILMFSLIEIPPLAGFWGKWFIFLAAIDAKLYWLAVIGFVTSVVIGAYYYLNIVRLMFFEKPAQAFEKPLGVVNAALLAGTTAFVLLFVVAPAPLADAALTAAQSLFK